MGSDAGRRNDFFEMVSYWTRKDHFNPGIKAEVIWDMLLSEYIPEIVSYCEEPEKEGCEGYRILAKEFPLRAGNKKDSLANARADYLVEGPRFLHLVELKTTDSSFDDGQFQRYCSYLGEKGPDEMWDFYLRVIDENVKTSYLEGKRREDYSHEKYLTHIKYLEQVKDIFGQDIIDIKNKETFDKVLRSRAGDIKGKKVKLIYLTLYTINIPKALNRGSVIEYEKNKGSISFTGLDRLIGSDFGTKKKLDGTTWGKIRELIESIRAEDIGKGTRS